MIDRKIDLREPLSKRLSPEVYSTLHQMVGAALGCWTDVEHAGCFQVVRAADVAFELCHYVADLLEEVREDCGDDSVGYITGDGDSLKKSMLALQIVEKIKAVNGNGRVD